MNKDPEKVNYNAFVDDSEEIQKQNPKIKESLAKKSRFVNETPKQTSVDFDHKVAEFKQQDVEIKNKIADLSTKYRNIIKDQTLEENKGPAAKTFEKEVIKQLCDVGLRLNNDSSQPEGIGSIGLTSLLLNIILIQRDTINSLSFQVSKINAAIKDVLDALKEDE